MLLTLIVCPECLPGNTKFWWCLPKRIYDAFYFNWDEIYWCVSLSSLFDLICMNTVSSCFRLGIFAKEKHFIGEWTFVEKNLGCIPTCGTILTTFSLWHDANFSTTLITCRKHRGWEDGHGHRLPAGRQGWTTFRIFSPSCRINLLTLFWMKSQMETSVLLSSNPIWKSKPTMHL